MSSVTGPPSSTATTIGGPWFEDFHHGLEFDAPAVTLTAAHAGIHQALFGDRLRLPLDHVASRTVTGQDAPLAHPLVAINIAIGFLAPGVDWRAHLGGLVVGAAVAALLVYAPRRMRTPVQVLGIAGVLAVLIAITLWRTAQIQEFYAPVSGMFA